MKRHIGKKSGILTIVSYLLFMLGLLGCSGDDDKHDVGGHPMANDGWWNIAIYNGFNNPVIYKVYGQGQDGTIAPRNYLMDTYSHCVLKKCAGGTACLYYSMGHRDHLYINAISLGTGYYNALYVTGNHNFSLASCNNQEDMYGANYAGAYLGFICPGQTSGDWLSPRKGSEMVIVTDDYTYVKHVAVIHYPDPLQYSCGNQYDIWVYAYSDPANPTVPTLSYNDVMSTSCSECTEANGTCEVPLGDWWEKCDWKNGFYAHGTIDEVYCQKTGEPGYPAKNHDFHWKTLCGDKVVTVDSNGTLECGT